METVAFEAEHRTEIGKNKVKQLTEGFIPAVIYGANQEPVAISVNRKELIKLYNRNEKGKNTILALSVTGDTALNVTVVAYQLDYHPVKRHLIHVDFLVVEDNVPVKVKVPCRLEGYAKGQKMAGILIHNLKTLKLSCLPAEIPAAYTIDITNVGIADRIRVSDLEVTGSIKLLNDPYDIILQIDAPRVEKALSAEEQAAEDTAASEPVSETAAAE